LTYISRGFAFEHKVRGNSGMVRGIMESEFLKVYKKLLRVIEELVVLMKSF
jgi:hypothetical protein